MSKHTVALVPLECHSFASLDLKVIGKPIDMGLFLEAIIYYECVYVNLSNGAQFAEFIKWFITQGEFDTLLALLTEGAIKFYDYAFLSIAIHDQRDDTFSLMNMQDTIQAEPNTFERRFLYHKCVEDIFEKKKNLQKLYNAVRGNFIEVKADRFGAAIDDARKDYETPERSVLVLQAFVDELYTVKKIGKPPQVAASILKKDGKYSITYNLDFNNLSALAGPAVGFNKGTPLTANVLSNRYLWSASELSCDLYLPSPMGTLVGNKLYETNKHSVKISNVIDSLQASVEFPDVRRHVNNARLTLKDVLAIRKQAKKFRLWLQTEGDKDRDAIIAYHNETAKEMKLTTLGRKTLSLFGILGGGMVGGIVGAKMAGATGGAVAGFAGSALPYITDLASKLGTDWKPLVFGNWYRDKIEMALEQSKVTNLNQLEANLNKIKTEKV